MNRRGGAVTGCLLWMLALAVIVYVFADFGEVYLRYYRYKDAMSTQARFAANRDDKQIQKELMAFADSLGVPDASHKVKIKRREHLFEIWDAYADSVKIGPYLRRFNFQIHLRQPL